MMLFNLSRTSTPVKARRKLASQFDQPSNEDGVKGDKNRRRGPKHNLTPGSKQNPNQPKSCTCTCRNHLFIMKTPQFEFSLAFFECGNVYGLFYINLSV